VLNEIIGLEAVNQRLGYLERQLLCLPTSEKQGVSSQLRFACVRNSMILTCICLAAAHHVTKAFLICKAFCHRGRFRLAAKSSGDKF
jgi:hypothetical protein